MKKISLALLLLLSVNFLFAQRVTKIVLLGDKGIVHDLKMAKSFIVMKRYPDGTYQRLNYKKGAPMESLQTYGDSSLSFFEGHYYKYNNTGLLSCMGYYKQNKKDSTWYYYNDTFKVIKKEIYLAGELVKTIDPDTLKKEFVSLDGFKRIETEASFPGMKGWSIYLNKTMDANISLRSVNGGKVMVCFSINTLGDVEDIYLRRSAEYILDEEAVRVIRESPAWNPAEQNGKKVKAFRIQPFTFIKD